jgi:MscS family membrane protein
MPDLSSISSDPASRALVLVAIAALAGAIVDLAVFPVLRALARRTPGGVDDAVLAHLGRPAAATVVLVGLWYAAHTLEPSPQATFLLEGLLVSAGAVWWAVGGLRMARAVIDALIARGSGPVDQRTRPLFDLVARVFFVGAGVYFLFLAWDVDVTAWLASAGILGIAIGFAAQDTLSNLFAGLSILVDRPYKIGDFLVLDQNLRGRVTDIGMRSTRIVTRDDVEVIIPNAQMANSRIINESGGPHERERVTAVVGVAYGSDIDHVRRVLVECAHETSDLVLDDPHVAPRVRFREFGDSALIVHLLAWVPTPELRGRALDDLNTRIYKRFAKEGIVIAYPTRHLIVENAKTPPEPVAQG